MALEKGNGSEEQMSVDIKSGEEYREETTDYDDGTGIAEGQDPETPEDDRLKAMDIAETAGDVAGEDLQEPGAVAESIVTDQLTDVVSDPEYTAAPETERPMSYADVVNETNGAPASQLPLFVPAGNGREADEDYLNRILKLLEIGNLLNKYPAQLSGGEQQRVAIARAMAAKPAIVLADEPTGNLDPKTSQQTLSLLKDTVAQMGQTLILVTHDMDVAAQAQEQIRIHQGEIVEITRRD